MDVAKDSFTIFSRWFSANFLALNAKKTSFIIFRNRFILFDAFSKQNFDCYSVNRCNHVTYLGVIFDEILPWQFHINALRDKIAKGVGLLKFSKCYLPIDCLLMICNSYVLPYLTYCIELWGNTCSYIEPIKLMQKSCFYIICDAYYLAHSRPLAKF